MPGIRTTIHPKTQTSLKTATRLAPSVLQGLKILSLPSDALVEYTYREAEKNPLLDIDYSSDLLSFDALPTESAIDGALRDRQAGTSGDPAYAGAVHSSRLRHEGASSFEWDFSRIRDDYSETETLHEYLRLQASCLHLPADEMRLLETLIDYVSEDGYFEGEEAEIAYRCSTDAIAVARMLEVLQAFEPAGVGARSVSECISLQIDDDDPHADLLHEIAKNHLDDLRSKRVAPLAKTLGTTAETARGLIHQIQAMDPRPGSSFFQSPYARYIIPDILVRQNGESFEAEVVGAGQPSLSLNKEYAAMSRNPHLAAEAKEYLEQASAQAELIIRNLDQRKQMLQLLALYLLQHQNVYFLSGGHHLAPMTMQKVADDLKVNVSTVSRTVQNKYIQTPWGTFPLKSFFTHGMEKQTGSDTSKEMISSFNIKQIIEGIIAKESKSAPYSDSKITDLLNQRGISIKRRTVAKYRTALGIESQSKRRA